MKAGVACVIPAQAGIHSFMYHRVLNYQLTPYRL
jgi:hypothetical protein